LLPCAGMAIPLQPGGCQPRAGSRPLVSKTVEDGLPPVLDDSWICPAPIFSVTVLQLNHENQGRPRTFSRRDPRHRLGRSRREYLRAQQRSHVNHRQRQQRPPTWRPDHDNPSPRRNPHPNQHRDQPQSNTESDRQESYTHQDAFPVTGARERQQGRRDSSARRRRCTHPNPVRRRQRRPNRHRARRRQGRSPGRWQRRARQRRLNPARWLLPSILSAADTWLDGGQGSSSHVGDTWKRRGTGVCNHSHVKRVGFCLDSAEVGTGKIEAPEVI
jgi:hypothetical protein